MVQTDQRFPSVSSQNKALQVNADGSVDVYFGPKAPAGQGEQLGADHSRQVVVHDPAPLRPAGAVVRQDLAAGRHPAGEVIAHRRSLRPVLEPAGDEPP